MLIDEAEVGEAESVQQVLKCEVGDLVDPNYAGDRGLTSSRDLIRLRPRIVDRRANRRARRGGRKAL